MNQIIDAKGLSCPMPVIKVKQAIENGYDNLEIHIDNEIAKENISKFLTKNGYELKETTFTKENIKIIAIKKYNANELTSTEVSCFTPQNKSFLILNNKIGNGDSLLGEKLMQAFLFTLTESDKPSSIAFMNEGVKLCIEGSESLENLSKLERSGVNIIVCGTCLNFYEISDKLMVGKVSNMYDIVDVMMQDNVITL